MRRILMFALAALLVAPGVSAGAAEPQEVLLLPVPSEADLSALKPAPEDIKVLSRMTIRKGDSLWRISRRVLGRGAYYPQLLAFNEIEDPDLIYEGRSLLTPAGTLAHHPELASRLAGKTAAIVFPAPAVSPQADRPAAPSAEGRDQKPIAGPAAAQRPARDEEAEVRAIQEMAAQGDCQGAIASSERFLARHPQSPRKATVLWHQAECYRLLFHTGP